MTRRTLGALVLACAAFALWLAVPAMAFAVPSVTGSVGAAGSDAPLAGIAVDAYVWDATFSEFDVVAETVTADDGSYALVGVPGGTYRIGFSDIANGKYLDQFWNHVGNITLGTEIGVADGATVSGIDASLTALPLALSGRVTDSGTNAGIGGVEVELFDNPGSGWQDSLLGTYTHDDGTWAMYGTPHGTYRFRFTDPSGQHATRYFTNSTTVAGGTSRTWSGSAAQTGINASLPAVPPRILGTVTDTASVGLAGIDVTAYQFDAVFGDWMPVAWTSTDGSGGYGLAVPDGSYVVGADDPSGLRLFRYYNGRLDPDSADAVVVSGAAVSAIDFALPLAPVSASGTVVNAGFSPVSDVEVTAWDFDASSSSWLAVETVASGADGSYALRGLGDGNHHVGFHDPLGRYADRFWNGKSDQTSADTVTTSLGSVAALGTTTLQDLPPSVEGTVRSAVVSLPLDGIDVTAWTFDPILGDYVVERWATTAADGTYVVRGLTDGSHLVSFEDSASVYVPQYFDRASTTDSATPVATSSGGPVTGVDAYLVSWASLPRGGIAGTVSGGTTSTPVSGATVQAYKFNSGSHSWVSMATTTTASDGTYSFPGVFGGNYRLRASDGGRFYHDVYWASSASLAAADNVVVTSDATTTANFTLPQWPSMSGTVTDGGSGLGVGGIDVTAYTFTGSAYEPYDSTITAADGTWGIDGLPGGIYFVEFFDPSALYPTVWYSGQNGPQSANPVVAGDNTHATGVNAVLTATTVVSLSGTVTDAKDASPISGATVSLFSAGGTGHTPLNTTSTDQYGRYGFSDLAPGTYRVSAANATHRTSFYDGASAFSSASDVVIATSQSRVAGIDFVLSANPAQRFAGADRYVVSANVAQAQGSPSGHDVILASGDPAASADPLAASGLSWAYHNAPIVLTAKASVPSSVGGYVGGLAASIADTGSLTVHVVGGTGSIPNARFTDLVNYVRVHYGVSASNRLVRDRVLATGSRYDLAAAIAQRMKSVRGSEMATYALVANGADSATFYDALALSPIAARNGAPILLVAKTSVPTKTTSTLASLSYTGSSLWLGGASSSVSDSVRTKLGIAASHRLWGATRYKTATAIADAAIARGWLGGTEVGVAAKLPDALTGGTFLGMHDGPLLFTTGSPLQSDTKAWITAHKSTLTDVWVFGGTGSVSTPTFNSVNAIFN